MVIREASHEVEVLIVDPDFMRQGIGRRLLEQLVSVAVDAGLEQLLVGSSVDGQPFYRACGFVDRGIRNRVGRRTGVEFQERLMEKPL
jgi:GNAT superfamily N-acetyltransferase